MAKKSKKCHTRCKTYVKSPRAKKYRADRCTTTKAAAKSVCRRHRAAGRNCKVVCSKKRGKR